MRVVIMGALGRMGQLLRQRWQETGLDVYGLDARGICETDARVACDTDVRGICETDARGTCKTDARGTCDTDARGACETDASVACDTDASVACETDARGSQSLTPMNMAQACEGAAAVVCCVPAAALHTALQLLIPYMPPTCVLVDITSVKVQPMEIMEKLWHGPIVGTHPLFGPAPAPDMELPVSISPGTRATEEHCALVEQLFQGMGCRTFRTTAEQHDEAMAAIQGLNFISSLAYFATLAQRDDLLPFLTPSFKRRQEAARKLLTEDAALFEGLFEANPYSQKLVRQFHNFLNIAASGDIDLLSARAAWWWDK